MTPLLTCSSARPTLAILALVLAHGALLGRPGEAAVDAPVDASIDGPLGDADSGPPFGPMFGPVELTEGERRAAAIEAARTSGELARAPCDDLCRALISGPEAFDAAFRRPDRLTVGHPAAIGALDAAIVRRYVKRQTIALRACFAETTRITSETYGALAIDFTIGGDGQAREIHTAGMDAVVAACAALVVYETEFPRARDGGATQVHASIALVPGSP